MNAGTVIRGDLEVVVVVGVGRYLGARVAARLAADPRVGHVIGVDGGPPPPALAPLLTGVELVETDLTRCATVIGSLDARAVVHLGVATAPDPHAGGRAAMKEQNVIGTMQLVAACQRAPRLGKLVVRSSTAAYGASFRAPAVFTEETEPGEVPRGGFARDILDIEGYVRGFVRRRPEAVVTVLRLAPLLSATADTTLTRYFAQPVVPTVLGRDPRLQFVHVEDAVEVLYESVVDDHPGTYNVAGEGVITLSQAIRRAGRIPLPVPEPALAGVGARLRRRGLGLDQIELFVHGRVVDSGKLRREFGLTPRTTAGAFADFLQGRGAGGEVLGRERLATAERAILGALARVRGQL